MDILDLTEVAELLGESDTVIRAACDRFPDHIPMVVSGRHRRFPSIALDVLRLVTDSMAAGAPDETTRHLIETHFPPNPSVPTISNLAAIPSLVPETPGEPEHARTDPEIAHGDETAVNLATVVRDEVAATVSPVDHKPNDELAGILECMGSMQDDVRHMSRADDLALLRVETRGIAASVTAIPELFVTVHAAITSLSSDLAKLRHASNHIQAEIASLQTHLDLRDQIAEFATELANLRVETQRLTLSAPRQIEHPRPIAFAAADGTGGGPRSSGEITRSNGHHPTEQPETDHTLEANVDSVDPTEGPFDAVVDQPTGIITQFASRTPRRMGRSLFADDV